MSGCQAPSEEKRSMVGAGRQAQAVASGTSTATPVPTDASEPGQLAKAPTHEPVAPYRPGQMGIMPAFPFHPRAADEWQGWRVDLSLRPGCDRSSRCPGGLACLADRQCGPCSHDTDCGKGEACVLDRCLLTELAGCRSREDCLDDQLCIMTEPSPDARGNRTMKSFCSRPEDIVPPRQERAAVEADYRRAAELNPRSVPDPPQAPVPPQLDYPVLLDRLRAESKQ